VTAVDRESAEDALFGDDAEVVAEIGSTAIDENAMITGASKLGAEAMRRTFGQEEIDEGVVLNAAVVLKEGVVVEDARLAVQKAIDEKNLGIKVVDWRSAAGILGQLVFLMAGILIVGAVVLFVIAMIIINNSVTMAIMQRTAIIGTMRAVGAQRAFVLGMVLFETLVLGLFFGLLGAGLGSALVSWMNQTGIPVPDERLEFLFGGNQLFPVLSTPIFVGSMVVVVVVTLLSTFLPAYRATRISPIRAMSTDE
jgi:ABC-type antimicrobial peptide transport system permease subunit